MTEKCKVRMNEQKRIYCRNVKMNPVGDGALSFCRDPRNISLIINCMKPFGVICSHTLSHHGTCKMCVTGRQ